MDVFPPRNLGLAEPWGREVENFLRQENTSLDLTSQRQRNLERHMTSRDTLLERQISQLEGTVQDLQAIQRRVSETVSTDSYSETVSGNSWGSTVQVQRPQWASVAMVIAGMDNVTNQSSPWYGEIEIIASNSSPVIGDVNNNKDPVKALVSDGSAVIQSNPRIVLFSDPGGSEDNPDPTTPLYLRARGIRQGGTSSRTYSFDVAYAVIWR